MIIPPLLLPEEGVLEGGYALLQGHVHWRVKTHGR